MGVLAARNGSVLIVIVVVAPLGRVKRLVASIDGVFISTPPGTKTFEIRLPLKA